MTVRGHAAQARVDDFAARLARHSDLAHRLLQAFVAMNQCPDCGRLTEAVWTFAVERFCKPERITPAEDEHRRFCSCAVTPTAAEDKDDAGDDVDGDLVAWTVDALDAIVRAHHEHERRQAVARLAAAAGSVS